VYFESPSSVLVIIFQINTVAVQYSTYAQKFIFRISLSGWVQSLMTVLRKFRLIFCRRATATSRDLALSFPAEAGALKCDNRLTLLIRPPSCAQTAVLYFLCDHENNKNPGDKSWGLMDVWLCALCSVHVCTGANAWWFNQRWLTETKDNYFATPERLDGQALTAWLVQLLDTTVPHHFVWWNVSVNKLIR
jgi:hypothetical protein